MRRFDRRIALAALLGSTTLAAAPAKAQSEQSAPDAPTVQDDIIVTAQKRDENIQDVPISIQALGTRKLDQLNISNFNEYTALLPSVAFLSTQPGVTTVYMRGVAASANGAEGNHSGTLPSVGSYLDEQPITTIGGTLDVHIYDIARIESLAGPQGTLYGASSEAGTIRIITNKPDQSGFYGRVDGEVNTVHKGGQGGKLEGMINAPITQDIALRVVGWYQHDAGYIDNVPGTRTFCGTTIFDEDDNAIGCIKDGISVNNDAFVEKDFNEVDIWGARAALKIDLDDRWTVTPTILYQEQRSDGIFGYDPSVGDLEVQRFYPDFRRDRFVQAALTIEGKIGDWDLTYAGAYLDRRASQTNDYTDYAEAYDSLYTSSGGVAYYFYFQDNAGNTIDPRQFIDASDHFKKMSQELRVSSPQSERFRIVAGAFFQRQSNLIHQDYRVPGLADDLSVNGLPGTLWLTQQHRVDKDYAMFGEASFDIVPTVTATVGGRAYIYDNSLIGFFGFGRNPGVDPDDGRPFTATPFNPAASSRTGVAGCYTTTGQILRDNPGGTLLPPEVAGGPCTNLADFSSGSLRPKRAQGQGVTYRFNLTWKPNDDVLLYGTWSRGFRPGGINRRATIPDYEADFLTNYELGAKTTLLDGQLRLNGAIYQQDWQAFQFSFLGPNSFTQIQNGPDARIRGIEMDANLSLGNLTLSAAGSYTDAETRQNLCAYNDPTFTCTAPGSTGEVNYISSPAGTRLPITPKLKLTGSARYTVPLGAAKAYVQALVTHQSSASADLRRIIQNVAIDETDPVAVADPTNYFVTADTLGRLDSFTTGNFAIGAEFSNYTVELFVQNAWDERAQLSRFEACGSCFQRPYIVTSTPRTIGLRAGAKF